MGKYNYNLDKQLSSLENKISKKTFDKIKINNNEIRYYKIIKQPLRLKDATKAERTIKLKDIKAIKLNYFNTYKQLIEAIQTKKQIKKVAKQRKLIKLATVFIVFITFVSVYILSQPKEVNLIIDGKEQKVKTNQFISSLFSSKIAQAYNLDNYRYKSSDDFSIKDNSTIKIDSLKELNIDINGKNKVVSTYASTMEELIKDEPTILLEGKDSKKYNLFYKSTNKNLNEVLLKDINNFELFYLSTKVNTKKITSTPKVKYVKTKDLENGVTKVKQKGKKEVAIKKITTLYLNDKKYDVIVDTKEIIEKGQPKIVLVGTKPVSPGSSVWDRLAKCESGGRWYLDTGNGFYGGLQFSAATWRSVAKRVGIDVPYANLASKAQQIKAATWLQKNSGWGQWPACATKLGLKK